MKYIALLNSLWLPICLSPFLYCFFKFLLGPTLFPRLPRHPSPTLFDTLLQHFLTTVFPISWLKLLEITLPEHFFTTLLYDTPANTLLRHFPSAWHPERGQAALGQHFFLAMPATLNSWIPTLQSEPFATHLANRLLFVSFAICIHIHSDYITI